MRTTGCFDRNRRETEWAVSRHCEGCLFFALEAIHLPDEHEYHKGDNQEVGQCVEEDAVIDRGCTRSFRLGQGGIGMSREVNEFVRKVRVAAEKANRGHQYVGNKRVHYSPKGRTNDDAHRHVEHTAAHREVSELTEHPATFFPQERFRAAQVSHSDIVESRISCCCHAHTSVLCSMLLGSVDCVK